MSSCCFIRLFPLFLLPPPPFFSSSSVSVLRRPQAHRICQYQVKRGGRLLELLTIHMRNSYEYTEQKADRQEPEKRWHQGKYEASKKIGQLHHLRYIRTLAEIP